VRRESISPDQLPAEVRRSIEQTTAGGTDHAFIRETRGNDVSYVVEYVVDGRRTSARLASDGKVLQASPLSGSATAGRQPASAAQTPQPAQSSAEPQLAAAREAAALGAFAVLRADQVPVPVRSAIEQNAQGGAADLLIQRFAEGAQVLYSAHFTDPQGRRMFMAVDESGKLAIEPRKSNAQEGGQGVRFEPVTADQLPPSPPGRRATGRHRTPVPRPHGRERPAQLPRAVHRQGRRADGAPDERGRQADREAPPGEGAAVHHRGTQG
jgi:hypothetical protein